MPNYTSWNPDDKSVHIDLSGGNLVATHVWGNTFEAAVRSVYGATAGRYYWELTLNVKVYAQSHTHGIALSTSALNARPGSEVSSYGYNGNGQKGNHNNWEAYGDTYATGDIISVALDMDSGKLWWGKNGTWQASGNPATGVNPAYTGISGTFYAIAYMNTSDLWGTDKVTANFGASAFSYSVPSSFNAGFGDGFLSIPVLLSNQMRGGFDNE